MQEVRTALLEADVNFKVVNDFTEHVIQKAIGQEVIKSLQPGQLMVKICYDELLNLLGPVDTRIYFVQPGPDGHHDVRPAGLGQNHHLRQAREISCWPRAIIRCWPPRTCSAPPPSSSFASSGEQVGVPVYTDDTKDRPAWAGGQRGGGRRLPGGDRAGESQRAAMSSFSTPPAGCTSTMNLMGELREINTQLKPHQIYLVLDSMSGQDAVNSAKAFNEQLELDGLILTKFDCDTRGGALLSAKMVTGKPVKFLGVGEKLDALEEFRPEGMASRILGMGDIVGLVTEAQEKFDKEETAKLQAKMEKGQFTLDDFMSQMGQIKKLGPMGKVMGMIPGMSELTKAVEHERRRRRAADGAHAGDLRFDDPRRAEKAGPARHGRRRRVAARGGRGSSTRSASSSSSSRAPAT